MFNAKRRRLIVEAKTLWKLSAVVAVATLLAIAPGRAAAEEGAAKDAPKDAVADVKSEGKPKDATPKAADAKAAEAKPSKTEPASS